MAGLPPLDVPIEDEAWKVIEDDFVLLWAMNLTHARYTIDIDFNHPELSQNKIVEYTLEVEEECPVAKEFGFSGIGEGIVFSYSDDEHSYTFKSKGIKHQKSKVKTVKKLMYLKLIN